MYCYGTANVSRANFTWFSDWNAFTGIPLFPGSTSELNRTHH